MLSRSLRTLAGKSQMKTAVRTILTSKDTFQQQPLAKEKEDIIVHSPYTSLEYPDISIEEYVFTDIKKWENKTALVDITSGNSVTYAQLRDKTRALAVRLQNNFKLQRGDTIAVCLPNSVQFPICVLAGLEASLTVTTVNPIYTPHEISKQLMNCNAKVLFGLTMMSPILEKAVELTGKSIKIVYIKHSPDAAIPAGGIDFSEVSNPTGVELGLLKNYSRDLANDVALLPYSSGTTGLSKGVQLSHKNIVSNCVMLNDSVESGISYPAIGDYQENIPCVLPFFHIYGFTACLMTKLAHGSKLVTIPKFTPELYLAALEKYPATTLYLVPPIIIFLTHYDKVTPKHCESVRYVNSGAAPIGTSDAEQFIQKAPNTRFIQGYGLTETSPVVLMQSHFMTNYASVGSPTPDTQAKIVRTDDDTMQGIGPNESGELLVRGPQVMLGYHNNEEATKNTITPDGWLRTGDIGYYDENLHFYITDRLKELIKVKGFQVPPAELEEVLRSHPLIADAAVIGIPDRISGELPRAYIVPKDENLKEEDVKKFVAEKVASYKRIEGGVEFIKQIPKNATGKILRKDLKEEYLKKM